MPIDWKFKTSSRHERRLMIENAYLAFEKHQREAEEWYSHEQVSYQEKNKETLKPEKKRRPPSKG